MNETLSRRKLVAMIGATGATAVAGCSGSSTSTGSNPDNSGSNSVFDGIEAVGIDGEARVDLQVSLVEDHGVDRIALQNAEGSELLSASVSPEETRVDLTIQSDTNEPVEPGPHDVIAYDGDTTVETTQWTATREITVEDVQLFGPANRSTGFKITLSNTGDLYVTPDDGFVSSGYPLDNNSGESVGQYTVEGLSAIWPDHDNRTARLSGNSFTSIIADGEQCSGDEMSMVLTLTFEEIKDLNIDVNIAPSGEIVRDGCTNTELVDWQTQ